MKGLALVTLLGGLLVIALGVLFVTGQLAP